MIFKIALPIIITITFKITIPTSTIINRGIRVTVILVITVTIINLVQDARVSTKETVIVMTKTTIGSVDGMVVTVATKPRKVEK